MSSTEPTATQTALLLWAFTGEWSILKWIVACTYFLSKFSLQSINEQQQNEPPILTNSSLLWSKSGWEHIIFPEKSPFTKGTKINHMIIRDKGDFLFFLQLAWQQLTSQLNQRKIPSPHARKIPTYITVNIIFSMYSTHKSDLWGKSGQCRSYIDIILWRSSAVSIVQKPSYQQLKRKRTFSWISLSTGSETWMEESYSNL